MMRDISVIRLIEVACRQEDVLPVIWEIQNIEKTEVKADVVRVNKQTEHIGTYQVRGHFAGIPWHNEFAYTNKDFIAWKLIPLHPAPVFKEDLLLYPLASRTVRSSITSSMSCQNGQFL